MLPQCSRTERQGSHGGHQQPPVPQGMQAGEGGWCGAVLRNPQLGLPARVVAQATSSGDGMQMDLSVLQDGGSSGAEHRARPGYVPAELAL